MLFDRVLAVEPDNAARYWYSSSPAGMTAFAEARTFFDALAQNRGEVVEPRVGPRLATLFAESGIDLPKRMRKSSSEPARTTQSLASR